jgi:hypothetical protein
MPPGGGLQLVEQTNLSKRMMQQAVQEGSIPQECFAKKNSHCNHAVSTKLFFCNSSRVLHHPAGMVECDFGDCYDHEAHPPTNLSPPELGYPQVSHPSTSYLYADNAICPEDRLWGIHGELWRNSTISKLRTRPRKCTFLNEVGCSHCISQSHNQWAWMPELLRMMSLPPQRC